MTPSRGSWASKFGFILAAAGSAVGLGNVWRFPYVTGENGGGVFVLVYLACTVTIGLPIMTSEVLLGRSTQRSPVAAFQQLAGRRSPWVATGWLGIAAGFLILSFYSVVAGWTLHYVVLSLTDTFAGQSPEQIGTIFSTLVANPWANVGYHGLFMALTAAVVIGGVQAGIERWSRILMPALFLMLLGLLLYALLLPGAGEACAFLFAPHFERFKASGALMALGQSFFSLSLGMGAMLTYGSYLPQDSDVPKSVLWIAGLDTAIALLAGLVVFPITLSHGMPPEAGPGLVFKSLPIAFSQMTGGWPLSVVFFLLLAFAALTSAISLQEVVTSSFIDLYGWSRRKVCLVTAAVIFVVGIPSALSGGPLFGAELTAATGRSFFDWVDFLTANWMLPVGGGLIAIYTGYFLDRDRRRQGLLGGSSWQGIYGAWLGVLRYLVPLAVLLVFLQSTGLLALLGVKL